MPAWHGVQWLPKLVGPAAAIDMMLTGKSIDAQAREAHRPGRPGGAAAHPREHRAHGDAGSAAAEKAAVSCKRLMLARCEASLRRRRESRSRSKREARALPGAVRDPRAVAEVRRRPVRRAAERPVVLDRRRCSTHPTTANLIRIFFLQERLKGLGKGVDFKARHVHVVGAGVMGGDIAAICAMRGLTRHAAGHRARAHRAGGEARRRAVQAAAARPAPRARRARPADPGRERRRRAPGRRDHRGDLREPRGQARAVREAGKRWQSPARSSPPTPRA